MTDHTKIISVDTLAANLANPDWIVLDCRFSLADGQLGRRQYAQDHIPGARYAHLDHDLAGEVGARTGRHPLPPQHAFARRLGGWRISPRTQVVVYDDGPGALAARLWWMLRWAGHHRVALLDGGYRAWRRAGLTLSDEVPADVEDDDAPTDFDDRLWLDTATVSAQLAQRRIKLVDARASARFRGEQEPLDARAGHIPGAINLPFQHNLGADGRFLPAQSLAERFAPLVPPDEGASAVVHMCGSGVTACHNLLAMEIAGLVGSRLYVGSWSEWSRDPHRPVAVG